MRVRTEKEQFKMWNRAKVDLSIRRLSVAVVSVGDPTAGPAFAAFLRGRPGRCYRARGRRRQCDFFRGFKSRPKIRRQSASCPRGAATKSKTADVPRQRSRLRPLYGGTQRGQSRQERDRVGCASASKWVPIPGERTPEAGSGFVGVAFCAPLASLAYFLFQRTPM